MSKVSFDSPYYPYEKVFAGANSLKGIEQIPLKVIKYLLDLPDASGYVPVDDNSRPRVRLIKYLYYDEPNPLGRPLPTVEQKLSILYNGENAQITTEEDKKNHPKGYRLYAQNYDEPSQITAKTMIRCFMARAIPRTEFKTILGIDFLVVVNYALDNNLKTDVYSRMYAIHQCLVEALHGVNIDGIGTVHYNKAVHGDCGFTLYHDEGTNIYSDTFMAIDWQETTTNEVITDW